MRRDPVGALRLALWGGDRVHWPGYQPWCETIVRSRAGLLRAARTLCLLPEILPPLVRDDVALLHAFCRHLDDTVDEAGSPAEAARGLERITGELVGREPPRPIVAALLAGSVRMGFPPGAVLALLDGMRADLGPVRIADDAELLRYSYRVSSSVGLILCHVLGVRSRGLPRAVDLGIALQLTNIVHGVGDDARRGRVYLPAERLAEAGLTPDDVLEGRAGRRLAEVMAGVVELADRYYRSADEGARDIPWRYRHGVLVMSRIYGALGRRAARAGAGSVASPVTLSRAEKARLLLQVLAVSLTPKMLGLSAPPQHDRALHAAIAGWPGTSAA